MIDDPEHSNGWAWAMGICITVRQHISHEVEALPYRVCVCVVYARFLTICLPLNHPILAVRSTPVPFKYFIVLDPRKMEGKIDIQLEYRARTHITISPRHHHQPPA